MATTAPITATTGAVVVEEVAGMARVGGPNSSRSQQQQAAVDSEPVLLLCRRG